MRIIIELEDPAAVSRVVTSGGVVASPAKPARDGGSAPVGRLMRQAPTGSARSYDGGPAPKPAQRQRDS